MNLSQTSAQSQLLSDIHDGIREATPIIFAVIPMAVVFGAVAVEHGFSLSEVLLTSALIYAAASQYVMLDLFDQQFPAWLIVLSVFAVNFRHILYSASIGRKMQAFSPVQKALAFFMLVDPQYAVSEVRASRSGLRPSFYFSYAIVVYLTWLTANGMGALFGSLIENPENLGIDFILPIYFIALVFGFHKRNGFFPILLISAGASMLVFFTLGSPWHITLGGIAGMIYAALSSKPSVERCDG